ncbi:MAG TPA: hypothetical protein V6D17_21735 [Candidatus Obscuribacterales bacterium]
MGILGNLLKQLWDAIVPDGDDSAWDEYRRARAMSASDDQE